MKAHKQDPPHVLDSRLMEYAELTLHDADLFYEDTIEDDPVVGPTLLTALLDAAAREKRYEAALMRIERKLDHSMCLACEYARGVAIDALKQTEEEEA